MSGVCRLGLESCGSLIMCDAHLEVYPGKYEV